MMLGGAVDFKASFPPFLPEVHELMMTKKTRDEVSPSMNLNRVLCFIVSLVLVLAIT